jgi:hypothetical protein
MEPRRAANRQNLACLIVDEVHKIFEQARGSSFERLFLSTTCPFYAFSGTISHGQRFLEWLEHLCPQREVHKLPTPEHGPVFRHSDLVFSSLVVGGSILKPDLKEDKAKGKEKEPLLEEEKKEGEKAKEEQQQGRRRGQLVVLHPWAYISKYDFQQVLPQRPYLLPEMIPATLRALHSAGLLQECASHILTSVPEVVTAETLLASWIQQQIQSNAASVSLGSSNAKPVFGFPLRRDDLVKLEGHSEFSLLQAQRGPPCGSLSEFPDCRCGCTSTSKG